MRRSRTTLTGLVLALVLGAGLMGPVGTAGAVSTVAPSAVTPATTGGGSRGDWQVTAVGADLYRLTWRSPTELPVTSARPEFRLAGEPLPAPSLGGDGRTLTLDLASTTEPRIADLEVSLSGSVLDEPARPAPPSASYAEPPAGRELTADPGVPGPYAVTSADYELSDLRIAGFPAPVERIGHVVGPTDRPASAGPAPLVLFLHGRHDYCFGRPTDPGPAPDWPCQPGTQPVPSQLGYRYAQRLLASQGYLTVSIAANGINAQDWRAPDGGAGARAELVRSHLGQWAAWAADGTYDVDLSRVVLVGHSRGGEGVDLASITTPLAAAYRIVGQVLIAPTDFARAVAAYVPTVVLLPYCDGDVYDLQGQGYTDRARDLTTGDTALRSSVLVMGANHNYFNTEWTPGLSQAGAWDDSATGGVCEPGSDTRLTGAEQRAVGKTWIAGAVALMADGADEYLPMFDGSDVEVPSAGGADVRTQALGGGRSVRRPGVDSEAVSSTPGSSRICEGRVGEDTTRLCSSLVERVAPHWPLDSPSTRPMPTSPAWEMAWSRAGVRGGLLLEQPWDLTGVDRLDLRTVVDLDVESGRVRVGVRLQDGSGATQVLTPDDRGVLRRLPGPLWQSKLLAQTLRVPLAGATEVDLADITRVDLVGRSPSGRVWVLDVAAATTTLPPVPERRLPQVLLDDVQVPEGDADGPTSVDVPFRLEGTLTAPARFVYVVDDPRPSAALQTGIVRLPAGASGGTVPVRYDADVRDDLARTLVVLHLYSDTGAMPATFAPQVAVVDDDPPPTITVRPESRRVVEGGVARWVISRSEAADYYTTIRGRIVDDGRDDPLTVADIPAAWIERHVPYVPAPGTPMYDVRLRFSGLIRPGRTGATLSLPIRRDALDDQPETLSMKVHVQRAGDPVVRTVTVVDR